MTDAEAAGQVARGDLAVFDSAQPTISAPTV
jgi:hypothetical protein